MILRKHVFTHILLVFSTSSLFFHSLSYVVSLFGCTLKSPGVLTSYKKWSKVHLVKLESWVGVERRGIR